MRWTILVGIAAAGAWLAPRALGFDALQPDDQRRIQSAGIRQLASSHLVLYTDVPSQPEIDRLPELFDQAVPQWAEYFGVDPADMAAWQPSAYLIADRRRFEALGLLPPGHEDFVNGFSLSDALWLYDQPTDYYRRHLLLHEGTHVFMREFLGGCGPEWYMEGIAELFGTHRLDAAANRLTLRVMPRDRAEVPMLGRIKLIQDAVAAGRVPELADVLRIAGRPPLRSEDYAWSWAAAKLLDSHPRYRDRFRKLKDHVLDPRFNDIVRARYADDWSDLAVEWRAFVATLEHGYDFERTAIDFQQGTPFEGTRRQVSIAADRGWQSSGVQLQQGHTYRLSATGRYQIAAEEQEGDIHPWPCEPGGVTIEYHDGRPLGMLLAAIDGRDERARAAGATLAEPIAIGLGAQITPAASGTLYLRVNDSPARLEDNRGTLTVTIEPAR